MLFPVMISMGVVTGCAVVEVMAVFRCGMVLIRRWSDQDVFLGLRGVRGAAGAFNAPRATARRPRGY